MCFPNETSLLNLNNLSADMEVEEMVDLFAFFSTGQVGYSSLWKKPLTFPKKMNVAEEKGARQKWMRLYVKFYVTCTKMLGG